MDEWCRETFTSTGSSVSKREQNGQQPRDKRPFLTEDSEDTAITDNNSIRRSCSCVYLKMLPADMVLDIKRGTVFV